MAATNVYDDWWDDRPEAQTEIPGDDDFLYDEDDDDDDSDWLYYHQLKQYLHESDLNEITAPSTESWVDGDPTRMRTKFGINVSRQQNWDIGIEEAMHVKRRVNSIFDVNDQDDVTFDMLINKFVGPDSEIGKELKQELNLDDAAYLKFMITYCIQSAYRVSSKSLYGQYSCLNHAVEMPEADYNKIWHEIAFKGEKSGICIGTGRRNLCLWQKLESKVNHELRSVSIVDRPGKISIALDDDKVWYNMAKKAVRDTFGIKITRHVKDNRIGMILHTAVSSALNIPLGCTFERVKENTQTCFTRIFQFMFGCHGGIDLANVNVHSDRGYSLPSVIFDFLIKNGANVLCTTKRFMLCWPFNFGGKEQTASDARTFIDSLGAPTLFIKNATVAGIKRVCAVAFRNGSGAVSTAVSSMHSGFEWEGVTEMDGEILARHYEHDPTSLQSLFFERVEGLVHNEEEDTEDEVDKDICRRLLLDKIDPLSIHQGESTRLAI